MKQVKPGRIPSLMDFVGSIIAVIGGIVWTVAAAAMGAPAVFPLFGVVFVLAGIGMAVYNYINAFGSKRISEYDIVDPSEEGTPDLSVGGRRLSGDSNYCPYCGRPLDSSFSFCPKCGKKLKS
ncbi:MAG TPA: zinc-ribbon domain-containing protein [Smithella sp.]|nr:zinc-ribbon domain-containing protein [Smithella sp.]